MADAAGWLKVWVDVPAGIGDGGSTSLYLQAMKGPGSADAGLSWMQKRRGNCGEACPRWWGRSFADVF